MDQEHIGGNMTELEKRDIEKVALLPYEWKKFSKKTIMISGGTGFIGSFISDVFRYRNERFGDGVKIISLSRNGGVNNQTVENIKLDITNPIVYDGKIDYILHLASNTHPKQYAEDPIGTIITNIVGCNNLLKFAIKNKKVRFLLASSVEIYGQCPEKLMNENEGGYIDCNDARSGYNEAKRTCEALCQSYRKKYNVDAVIVRLARFFGADRKKDTKALAQFMQNSVEGKDIILKSQGKQRYSFCYVADVASAIIKVLLDGKDGETYNIAEADEGCTLGGYANFIAKLGNREVKYQLEENENVSKAVYALLNTKKIEKIGWKAMYSVSDGMKRTFEIYKERENDFSKKGKVSE